MLLIPISMLQFFNRLEICGKYLRPSSSSPTRSGKKGCNTFKWNLGHATYCTGSGGPWIRGGDTQDRGGPGSEEERHRLVGALDPRRRDTGSWGPGSEEESHRILGGPWIQGGETQAHGGPGSKEERHRIVRLVDWM